jgi:condensin complex subunit 2
VDSQPLYADTDSEGEFDHGTPRKQPLKKRLSEVYNPDHDHSFSSDPGRIPLKSVNINDDTAEKRRRRKSTKLAVLENAQAGPSSEGTAGEPDVAETSRTAKQKQQLKSVAEPPVINVPLDVMSSNFEEWMQMATDNVDRLILLYPLFADFHFRKSMQPILGISL